MTVFLGDWSKGFRGLAALPKYKKEFQESIGTAIQYAKTLNCNKVHIMAGIPAKDDGDVSKVFVENVSYAAAKLGEANLMCLIEPINHYTIPGYFLSSYEQGYIQVAQVPSRDEPSTSGEIDYKYVFGLLQSTNPNWTIGLEHNFHDAHGAPRDWVPGLGLTM
ncbi:hypothetical protein ANCCEY_09234 [Ancylostoma ceylanicum]|uniref:Xylose isomerase-like TIM barrel domain-containing protein n=1 Tax=Ancylostoma ceylanicum TaxID=53326 RepID=A0A0D6LNR6_9BILA|nr:hypothetical protein ANCCEY_09234 [Ancylostoma ceylanicum]